MQTIGSPANRLASSTVPPSLMQHQIGAAKRMSALAVSLRNFAVASSHIFSMNYDFHVKRINAISHSAKMVNLEAIWNFTTHKFIGESVGSDEFPCIDGERSITTCLAGCSPNPARPEALSKRWNLSMSIDFCPEAFHKGRRVHSGKTLYQSLSVFNLSSRRWNKRESFAVSTPLEPVGMFLAQLVGWAVLAP